MRSSHTHYYLGAYYHEGRDLKKAKFHYEAAAMAGHEGARCNIGAIEFESGNKTLDYCCVIWELGIIMPWTMDALRTYFERGLVSRESIDSTLKAYNNSYAEMRSEARYARI